MILITGCKVDSLVRVNPKCGEPCYPDEQSLYAGVGVCSLGINKCIDDTITCEDYILPGVPQCNGLDNDCNGHVDRPIRECSTICGQGFEFCINNKWAACNAPQPKAEVCNGLDDDCNGKIDDFIYNNQFCYTGPQSSAAKGECRPGFWVCAAGHDMCYGERIPSLEICNGLDDDCDGVVDNGVNVNPINDFVIIMDNSGSMGVHANKLKSATLKWAARYTTQSNIRFALVGAPSNDPSAPSLVTLVTNFTDANTFAISIAANCGWLGSSDEATLDAIKVVEDPLNSLHLTWTPGSKRTIIMFTDEAAQSYMFIPKYEDATLAAYIDSLGMKIPIILYTEPGAVADTFKQTVAASSGKIEDITVSEYTLGMQLDALIASRICE